MTHRPHLSLTRPLLAWALAFSFSPLAACGGGAPPARQKQKYPRSGISSGPVHGDRLALIERGAAEKLGCTTDHRDRRSLTLTCPGKGKIYVSIRKQKLLLTTCYVETMPFEECRAWSQALGRAGLEIEAEGDAAP